jgi:hypothetical protein
MKKKRHCTSFVKEMYIDGPTYPSPKKGKNERISKNLGLITISHFISQRICAS